MGRPASMKTEEAWNVLYSVGGGGDDIDDKSKQYTYYKSMQNASTWL
jgi:hypothetical protein